MFNPSQLANQGLALQKQIPWINVAVAGADPTGTVDSTAVINNIITGIIATGGNLYFPAGTYLISGSGIAINQSAITLGFASNARINIYGDGDGNTTIKYTQTSGTNYALSFTGAYGAPSNYGWYTRFCLENLHFVGPGIAYTNNGIYINQGGTIALRNVTCSGFNYGIRFVDVIGTLFENCNFMFNNYGGTGAYSAWSAPNAVTFTQCAIMYNAYQGFQLTGGSGINFYGGYVQNNANTANAGVPHFGLKCDFSGSGGAGTSGLGVGINIYGTYFENNGDSTGNSTADLWILTGAGSTVGSANNSQVNGCFFVRGDTTFYSTNNVQWNVSGTAKQSLSLFNCSFSPANSYTSNGARPYVGITATGNVYEFVEHGNLYGDPINAGSSEKPVTTSTGGASQIAGMIRGKAAMATAWGNFSTVGGFVNLRQGFNITSVSYLGVGNARMTFTQSPGNFYAVATAVAFQGIVYVSNSSTTSVEFQMKTLAGVALEGVMAFAIYGGDIVG